MNDQRIDRLFHEKLASFEVQPSSEAWNKIEAVIPKKNKKSLWYYSIAASVTLVLASSYVLIQLNTRSETSIAQADNQLSVQNTVPIQSSNVDPVIKTEKNGTLNTSNGHQNPVQKILVASTESTDSGTEKVQSPGVIDTREQSSRDVQISIDKTKPEFTLIYAQSTPVFKPLPENNTDLTLPDNENGLRKVYDYAVRVKNGEENPIDLRKAKEELFAMARSIKINPSKTN